MLGTRYDGYKHPKDMLPFVLHVGIERTSLVYSKEKNWHEDLELELCESGEGTVLLNGKRVDFQKDDIVAVNSNVIHYTGTESELRYTCLIIGSELLKQVGVDYDGLYFDEKIKSDELIALINELKNCYSDTAHPCRVAKLYSILLNIIVVLTEKHATSKSVPNGSGRAFENVKATIRYIRENYASKITLYGISRAVCADKYTLCRDFKRLTGQTIIGYVSAFRCQMAADRISEGATVAEAAHDCGFENLSFFTKTFKTCMGALPSSYKKS